MRSTCGILALASACAGATAGQPTEEDYADVAISIGSTTSHDGGEVGAMRTAAVLARGERPAGLADGADGAVHGALFGLDYRYAITCRDPAGELVRACDRATGGADVDAAWSGTLDTPRLTLAIAHDARWQLSGMVGAITHVAGTGQLSYDTRDGASAYHYAYDAAYQVVIDDQRAIGGAIQFAITAEHTGSSPRRFAIAADVTFEPDDTAMLVLDGARRYRIMLATGAVIPWTGAGTGSG